jgi:hypothetical protein
MQDNPLDVLGLTPKLVRKLNLDQLMKVVDKQYKSLMHLFHSDTGGDDEKAKVLNEANDLFKQDPKFYRSEYIKKGGKKEVVVQDPVWFDEVLCPLLIKLWHQSENSYVDLLGLTKDGIRLCLPKCGDPGLGLTGIPTVPDRVRRRQRLAQEAFWHLAVGEDGRLQSIDCDDVAKRYPRLLIGGVSSTAICACNNGSNEPIHQALMRGYRQSVKAATRYFPAEESLPKKEDFFYPPSVIRANLNLFSFWTIPEEFSEIFSVEVVKGELRFYREGTYYPKKNQLIDS